jgi:hypothetical protein
MWYEKIADSQYGIPTPKALPAFSADEAEKVARDFGKSPSLPLHRSSSHLPLSAHDEQRCHDDLSGSEGD